MRAARRSASALKYPTSLDCTDEDLTRTDPYKFRVDSYGTLKRFEIRQIFSDFKYKRGCFGRRPSLISLAICGFPKVLSSRQNLVFCYIMAACFSVDSDSNASFSDILAPPASQSRSSKTMAARILSFGTVSGLRSSMQIDNSQTGVPKEGVPRRQVEIDSKEDFEDDSSGYTPPPAPAKRKGTFQQPIELTSEKSWRPFHEFMKPSKVNCKNSSRAKHLLQSHSSFFDKSPEQADVGEPRQGFPTSYSRLGYRQGESSAKRQEREFLAWEKANSGQHRFQDEMSLAKSLSDFSNFEGDKRTEEEIQSFKKLRDARRGRNGISDLQYVGRVTSTILRTGMPKTMKDEKFVKVKLEKAEILNTKRKSCCKNYYLQKLGTHGIRDAREKYF
jgi:hypothetical protein